MRHRSTPYPQPPSPTGKHDHIRIRTSALLRRVTDLAGSPNRKSIGVGSSAYNGLRRHSPRCANVDDFAMLNDNAAKLFAAPAEGLRT